MYKQVIGLLVFAALCAGGYWGYKNYYPRPTGPHIELASAYDRSATPGMRAELNGKIYLITSVQLANESEVISEAQRVIASQGSPELVILDPKLPIEKLPELNLNIRLRIFGVRIK